jgi:formylglycine-generating enzyme required for sulfatase activity
VSWKDITRRGGFLEWLNRKAGLNPQSPYAYRLPTEAEREYATRAGSDGLFSLGPKNSDRIDAGKANYDASSKYNNSPKGQFRERTVPVKGEGFEPNAWGLYHMHGNVQEWTADCYSADTTYQATATTYQQRTRAPWLASQRVDHSNCKARVLRGGGWFDHVSDLRSANPKGRTASSASVSSEPFRFATVRVSGVAL